jgi:hypothetical protein
MGVCQPQDNRRFLSPGQNPLKGKSKPPVLFPHIRESATKKSHCCGALAAGYRLNVEANLPQ